MSNSSLVNVTMLSPNYGSRTHKIDTITIHHMACNLSVEACGAGFAARSRNASSNYGVGTDGRIGMYVEEKNRSFCSSSFENDNRAITIEVANDSKGPDWHVSDTALEATINLCVDICKRNNIKKLNYTGDKSGNLTMHQWFAYTACPGPYLSSKFPYIAEEVNRRLGVTEDFKDIVTDNVLSIGDVIELVPGATYVNGKALPAWLYNMTLYVRGVDGDNITFSIYKTGATTGIISRKYIVNGNESQPVAPTPSTSNKPVADSNLSIGSEVKLISGATYYDGKSMPSWLFNMTLYVRGINGDNITISTLKTGAITGAVNKKYLKLLNDVPVVNDTPVVEDKPVNSDVLKIGDTVKLVSGATYYNGKSMPSWLFNMTLYVRGISGENITISTLKTGDITGMVNKKYLVKC